MSTEAFQFRDFGFQPFARDRGGPYAEGAKQGAPQARQVADRFHLLVNLSETLETFFLNKQTVLKEAVSDPQGLTAPAEGQQPPRLWHKGVTTKQEEKSLQLHQERVERYQQVHDLHDKKADVADIARQLNMARRTVYHYLKMEQPPQRMRIMNRKTPPKKVARIKITCSDGGTRAVAMPRSCGTNSPIKKTTTKRPPSAKQVSRWITLPSDRRLDWQNAYLERLLQADPLTARRAELMVNFATMLRERTGERLDEWLEKVEAQEVPELRRFAQGLRKDYDAVKAGRTLCWSNDHVA